MGIFSRSRKSSLAKSNLPKEELIHRIYELIPNDLLGSVNDEVYTRQRLISHVRPLVEAMFRNSDEELTMFILQSAAALSTDLHQMSIEDGAEFAIDRAMASVLLRERYSNEEDVVSGIVAFSLMALDNLEAHPNYRDILIRMTSIANDKD